MYIILRYFFNFETFLKSQPFSQHRHFGLSIWKVENLEYLNKYLIFSFHFLTKKRSHTDQLFAPKIIKIKPHTKKFIIMNLIFTNLTKFSIFILPNNVVQNTSKSIIMSCLKPSGSILGIKYQLPTQNSKIKILSLCSTAQPNSDYSDKMAAGRKTVWFSEIFLTIQSIPIQ